LQRILDTSLLKSGLHVAGGFAAALYDLPCVVSSVDWISILFISISQ
jgi:hypothetical protein